MYTRVYTGRYITLQIVHKWQSSVYVHRTRTQTVQCSASYNMQCTASQTHILFTLYIVHTEHVCNLDDLFGIPHTNTCVEHEHAHACKDIVHILYSKN